MKTVRFISLAEYEGVKTGDRVRTVVSVFELTRPTNRETFKACYEQARIDSFHGDFKGEVLIDFVEATIQ